MVLVGLVVLLVLSGMVGFLAYNLLGVPSGMYRAQPPSGFLEAPMAVQVTSGPKTGYGEVITEPPKIIEAPLTYEEPAPEPYYGGREIIYTAMLTLRTEDIGLTVSQITGLTESFQGYISSMSVGKERANIVVRVPSEDFFNFIEQLSQLGEVKDKSIKSEDVTDRIIELDARLRNAEAEEQRLLEMFKEAQNVTEMLQVEKELNRVREQIEILKAQLQNLQSRIAYSTIMINLEKVEGRATLTLKVLDIGGEEVPRALILVKPSNIRLYTDELGEAQFDAKRGENLTLFVRYYRSDGAVLKGIAELTVTGNKTITIGLDGSKNPPPIDLNLAYKVLVMAITYVIVGLLIIVVIAIPLALLAYIVILIYKKAKK